LPSGSVSSTCQALEDVDIIYRYTDTQGFKVVVEKAAVWATDFRYLNDSRELIYTWTAFVERFESLVRDPPHPNEMGPVDSPPRSAYVQRVSSKLASSSSRTCSRPTMAMVGISQNVARRS
jgi:hypothetical protein